MNAVLKKYIKLVMNQLPFAVTKNIYYDRLTVKVIERVCQPTSNCIDIGCFKGEVLDIMLQHAPQGTHHAFEPIPDFFKNLQVKYKGQPVTIINAALANQAGQTTFNYVMSNPSYSGLQKRHYDRPNEQDQTITVNVQRLDESISSGLKIDLIKIDVEGAEMDVLRGATGILTRYTPVVVFEFGIGASDVYGTTPGEMFDFWAGLGYQVSLLDRYLDGKTGLSREELCRQYEQRVNYYFIGYKQQG